MLFLFLSFPFTHARTHAIIVFKYPILSSRLNMIIKRGEVRQWKCRNVVADNRCGEGGFQNLGLSINKQTN